jgi:hypothetical protein
MKANKRKEITKQKTKKDKKQTRNVIHSHNWAGQGPV